MVADVVRKYKLFPAYAGVILGAVGRCGPPAPFPRICGGDPPRLLMAASAVDFSPHMRG